MKKDMSSGIDFSILDKKGQMLSIRYLNIFPKAILPAVPLSDDEIKNLLKEKVTEVQIK